MSIKNKILLAIGLGIVLTIFYYYTYAYFQIWFKDLCKKNYCIEFFPIGDFIACYIAIVGLYFVVTSLNEWKTQEKYFKSRSNLELLTVLCTSLKNINENLLNLKMTDLSKLNPNDLLLLRTLSKGGLNSYLNEQLTFTYEKVIKRKHTLDEEKEIIVDKSNGLYQKDINWIFEEYSKIILKASSELNIKIEEKETDTMENYKQELEDIYNKYNPEIIKVLLRLEDLERKLNSFLDG